MTFQSSHIFRGLLLFKCQSSVDTTRSPRTLVGLDEQFGIREPRFAYDYLQFTLEYAVNDRIDDTQVQYRVFDGKHCHWTERGEGGDNDITQAESNDFLRSRLRADLKPVGIGDGNRTMKVTLNIDPLTIKASPVYEDFDSYATVKFCVRFSVFNMDTLDPNNVEVNFLETEVHLLINLVDDFVDAISQLSDIDLVGEMADQGSAVEAYICDSDLNFVEVDARSRIQGEMVRVCVAPTELTMSQGAYLRYIEEFSFYMGEVIQVAIEPGTLGSAADALTIVDCQPGSELCVFETLLRAEFFEEGSGVVTGRGVAFLQFGRGVPLYEVGEGEALPDFSERYLVGPGDLGRKSTKGRSMYALGSISTSFQFDITSVPRHTSTWRAAIGYSGASTHSFSFVGALALAGLVFCMHREVL